MDDQGGKRHFELLVAVIVISLVALVFYGWVERLAIKVEQARIQYTLSNLRSAIKIQELTMLVAGRSDELFEYHYGNPMEFMDAPPFEYSGEFEDGTAAESGSWFFNRQSRQLIYSVISVESNQDKAQQLCYQLHLIESVEQEVGRLRLTQVPCQEKVTQHE
ncbi:MAG: hypothetical protein JXA04_04800 [Gammaproteobacteria bacterium]|nr:hypothetical protein [Gammaproteobacteria bacterium]